MAATFRATQAAALVALRASPATFRLTQAVALAAIATQPSTFFLTQAVALAALRAGPDYTWGAMFYELIFPDDIAFGSEGGPGFNTDAVEVESGYEQRTSRWSEGLAKYNVAYGVRDQEQLGKLIAFHRVVKGAAIGFLYKDWSDYSSAGFSGQDATPVTALDQSIGTGDGTTKVFQITKTYSFDDGIHAPQSVTRTIGKLRASTVVVALASAVVTTTAYTVDATAGTVTFTSAVASTLPVQAGYEFYVPARFTTDDLPVRLEDYGVGNATVLIEEIRTS